jgi:hypothetical protein
MHCFYPQHEQWPAISSLSSPIRQGNTVFMPQVRASRRTEGPETLSSFSFPLSFILLSFCLGFEVGRKGLEGIKPQSSTQEGRKYCMSSERMLYAVLLDACVMACGMGRSKW